MVAGAILAAAMNALVDDNPPLVFQASSGDSNPNDMKRMVGLVGLYKREYYKEKETGNKLLNNVAAMIETAPVSQKTYERYSAPMFNKLAKRASNFLDKAAPDWAGGRLSNIVSDLKKSVESFEETTAETMDAFAMFKPFMIDNAYEYRSDNVRALMSLVKEKEKNLLPWYPEKLDWYDYWLNVHFPGMRKWVLPQMEEDLKKIEKRSYTYKDLLDLFDTSVKRFPTRVAMKIERNGRKEQYTFADVKELTYRAAGFFADKGIEHGNRVILFSNNMPEWGISYFGILKTGATAIPIDPASSIDEILKFAETGEASAIMISPKLLAKIPNLENELKEANLNGRNFQFRRSFRDSGRTGRSATKRAFAAENFVEFGCVFDFYKRHDRHAESRDAVAQKFRQYDLDALVRFGYGHHRRRFVGFADASYV